MVREVGAGIRAALEAPAGAELGPEDLCSDRRLPVRGFAYRSGAGPLRVRARLGSGPWAEDLADDFRDDVGACEPLCPEAGRSGFGILVEVGAQAGLQCLRVEALLPEGPVPLCLRELVVPAPGDDVAGGAASGALRGAAAPAASRVGVCARPEPPARVLFVTHDLALEGSQRSLFELSRSLDRARFRPRWLAPQDGPLAAELAAERIPLDLRALRPQRSGDALRESVLRSYLELPELARVRLVVANTLQSFWGLELARALGVPAVWIVRESVDPQRFLHRFWPARAAERALQGLGLADRLVFVSQATAKRYRDFATPDRIEVIPNGIDLARFGAAEPRGARDAARRELRESLGLPGDARVLLCVGTICQRKGQEVLLRALARLAERRTDLHAVLLGARAHPYVDALRAAAERLGLAGRVHLLPRRADPRPCYLGADLALCPSYQESLPRSVLEAMACALPIVASAVDGIPELLRDGREGRLVPPGDPAALAAAIDLLLADPARAAELGAAARKRAEAEFPLRAEHAELRGALRGAARRGLSAVRTV